MLIVWLGRATVALYLATCLLAVTVTLIVLLDIFLKLGWKLGWAVIPAIVLVTAYFVSWAAYRLLRPAAR